RGNTPLHLAASLKPAGTSSNMCQALLEKGANPTIQNQDKESFIFTLLRRSATENIELLITLALQYQPDLLSRNSEQQMVFLKDRPLPFPVMEAGNPVMEAGNSVLEVGNHVMEVGTQSGKPRKKVKLFICGHSGVGKTTFVNTLKETGLLSKFQYYFNGTESPPSTQGVSCSETNLKDGSLVIWDFAGQMEYCFTHSLLLNTSGPNTIYCVVFSLKGIESDLHGAQKQAIDQMIFWLRFLSLAYNPDSLPHVIIIGSHLDTLPEENHMLIGT
ncbi:hypothetical protein AB205_0056510, partial [Aquarana catesbeiana]